MCFVSIFFFLNMLDRVKLMKLNAWTVLFKYMGRTPKTQICEAFANII